MTQASKRPLERTWNLICPVSSTKEPDQLPLMALPECDFTTLRGATDSAATPSTPALWPPRTPSCRPGWVATKLPRARVSHAASYGSSARLTIYAHGKKDFPEKIKEAGQCNQLTQTPPLSKYAPISKTIKTAPLNNTCSVQRKYSMMGLQTGSKENIPNC